MAAAMTWQFYVGLAGALGGCAVTALFSHRYILVLNYSCMCHLELDPIIKENLEIQDNIRRSEIEGFYEEVIEDEKKKRASKSQRA